MRTTIDSRLALGLLLLSVLALGAFVAVGFRPLSSRRLHDPDDPKTRPAERVVQAETDFVNVSEEWGLAGNRHDTVGKAGAGVTSIADAIAPGVGLLDLDGDGDLDLVQLNGPAARVGLTFWINQRKESGRTRFLDRTEELGVRWAGAAQGICAGDVDNDGDVDLFVTANGPKLLLQNQLIMKGKRADALRFDDVSETAGIKGGRWHWTKSDSGGSAFAIPGPPSADEGPEKEVSEFSSGATFGDFDGDGDLDLYVVNYVAAFEARWAQESAAEQVDRPEKIQFQPRAFDGMPDRMYLNETGADGVVRFREVTAAAGVNDHEPGRNDQQGRGLTATFMRVEEKIYPDVYVVTDAGVNLFFHNVAAPADGKPASGAGLRRRFEDATSEFGLADRRSGMGLARGDADADGDLDLLTTNWRNPASLFLYRQEQRVILGTNDETLASFFDERGVQARIAEDTAPLIGWGCVFFDYDDDGDEDLFIGNGATSPRDDQPDRCGLERVLLFRNRGSGVFDNVTASAGAALQQPYGARGVVAGDVDRDGDLDLVIAQNNGPLVVLENRRPPNGNRSLTIVPKNRRRGDAINQEIVVNVGQQRLVRELLSGSSYLSQEPFEAHFGLGRAPRADRVQVTWPWLEAPPPSVREKVDAGIREIEQGNE